MKPICPLCKQNWGEDKEAIFIAPQRAKPTDPVTWIPICGWHADGWFVDCEDWEPPGQMYPIDFSQPKTAKKWRSIDD